MRSGELKDIVTEALQLGGESSVRDVVERVEKISGKDYAYTTIATILQRLEDDGILISEKKKLEKRKKKYYRIRDEAPKEEAETFLKSFLAKFGSVGVRHLGEVMASDFSDEEIEELRRKLTK